MLNSSLVTRASPLFLGVDIGTSGLRGVIINEQAEPMAEYQVPLPAPDREGTAVEQSAQLWWQALVDVITALSQQVDLTRIEAIAIDGTSATVLLADKHGTPLGKALMYNDSRARDQLEKIAAVAPGDFPVHSASSGLAKICWLLQHTTLPEQFHILHQADWLAGQLCQRFDFTDSNNALKTGFDVQQHNWPHWLSLLLPMENLPRVFHAGESLATIDPGMAEKLGLPADTRIAAGTTDSTAAIYATGICQPGEAVTSLGSTLVVKILSDTPVTDTRRGVYSQPYGDLWLVGGASNSGGAVLRQYFSDAQMKQLQAELRPAEPVGLGYYPLPARGERFPVNDPLLEPVLTPRPQSDRAFFQAILEGIAEIEKQAYDTLHALGAPEPVSIRSVGRGAHNPGWTAIRHRVLNIPMVETTYAEAAYGAALLAHQSMKSEQDRG